MRRRVPAWIKTFRHPAQLEEANVSVVIVD